MNIQGKLPYSVIGIEMYRFDVEKIQEDITKTFFPEIPKEEYQENPLVHAVMVSNNGPVQTLVEKALLELEGKNFEVVVIYNPNINSSLHTIMRRLVEGGTCVLYHTHRSGDRLQMEHEPKNLIQVEGKNIDTISTNIVTELCERIVAKFHANQLAKHAAVTEQQSPPYGTPAD